MRVKECFLLFCVAAVLTAQAQDTSNVKTEVNAPEKKTKLINQEFGFNVLAMMSQFDLIKPIPGQLPYTVMYNIYYKNEFGLRLGAGVHSSNDQSETEGAVTPTISSFDNMNFRAGLTWNIASHRKVTINALADFLLIRSKSEILTTNTVQAFPDPLITRTMRNTMREEGYGFQAGFGVKLDIYRNLSLYTEIPIGWRLIKQDHENLVTDDGGSYNQNISRNYSSVYFITVPVSIYLLLRF